ncbi:MAG: bifunctional diaminohydroxyphosphoribosylaminopyrimidine deaminase/5-amino-6-(5-phosphoribosylamino)uracil reductase RibD [Pseudomonadota bacterium]
MAACARLAARGRTLAHPNPSVAALLVQKDDGQERVIGRGWTQIGGRPHAEAMALAGLNGGSAKDATLYVTLEPCAHKSNRGPACSDLIVEARPARVVVGCFDPDPRTYRKGVARIEKAEIPVTVLEDGASRDSLAGYLSRAQKGRPYITLKLATSLDGCIATVSGESQWITGEAARAHVHSQRAHQDAILVGGGTWRSDQPRLDVRLDGLAERSPKRLLLSRGVAPDDVRVLDRPDQVHELTDTQYLYVEGGAGAAASFLAEDLVDELHLYRAPILIGSGQHAIGDIGLGSLSDAHGRWTLKARRQLGSDVFESYLRT